MERFRRPRFSAWKVLNLSIVAVLKIAQEELVDASVRGQALSGIGHVVGRIRRENVFDNISRESFGFRCEFSYGNSGKSSVPALKFDLSLDRSLFQARMLLSSGIQRTK